MVWPPADWEPMRELDTAWSAICETLGAPPGPARKWGGRLKRAYAGPLRAYHTTGHIAFLLAEIDRRRDLIGEPLRLRLAAFFHDFIYRTWRKDNEARSADAAGIALAQLGAPEALADRVRRLILWTAGHAPLAEADQDDLLFLDMDLSILGAAPEVYQTYARGVRREYFHVPERLYRSGRSAFLEVMIARPRLFNTDLYEAELGVRAKANMVREVEALCAGPQR